MEFGGHFEKNTEKSPKKSKKSTFRAQKVAVRGSDDKKYFFIIFLRKKLYLAKKTWVKLDFCCRDKNYFVLFSEEKNDISQKSPKYRKAEPEPEKNMRKKFSVSSYPSVKNGFAKNRVFLSEGVNFHAGGLYPPRVR